MFNADASPFESLATIKMSRSLTNCITKSRQNWKHTAKFLFKLVSNTPGNLGHAKNLNLFAAELCDTIIFQR